MRLRPPPPGLGVVKWPAGRVKREWVGAADFVYSHELITAEAPLQLLGAWARCLRPAGVITFEWCDGGGAADEGPAEAEGGVRDCLQARKLKVLDAVPLDHGPIGEHAAAQLVRALPVANGRE